MNSGGDTLAGGFPHSEIRGSTIARISPRLIAACYVLHRLLVPRHPPNALLRLISSTSFMTDTASGIGQFDVRHPSRPRQPRKASVRYARRAKIRCGNRASRTFASAPHLQSCAHLRQTRRSLRSNHTGKAHQRHPRSSAASTNPLHISINHALAEPPAHNLALSARISRTSPIRIETIGGGGRD